MLSVLLGFKRAISHNNSCGAALVVSKWTSLSHTRQPVPLRPLSCDKVMMRLMRSQQGTEDVATQ